MERTVTESVYGVWQYCTVVACGASGACQVGSTEHHTRRFWSLLNFAIGVEESLGSTATVDACARMQHLKGVG
eukprot:m.365035 g.365035  ORF g.365035 m.365035 type:complete len:73 (+) comp29670_c0_seq1:37-255(+)